MSESFSLFLVSHSYPPVLGGSEIEAQRVCSALIRRGHKVTVLCAGGGPMPRVSSWVDAAGVPVRIFGHFSNTKARDYAFALRVAWTLLRNRRQYQLVYFLMHGLHLAAGLPVARWLGKPTVMKFSGSTLITHMGKSWLGRLELRWLQKWAGKVMILNPGMAAEAAAAGFALQHLLWMPNPVDTNEFAPCGQRERDELRSRLAVHSEAQVTLFAGRLAPEKEIPSLLDAFASLSREFPESLLVFVGDGPTRGALEDQARRLGVRQRVRFTGALSSSGVREWMQASDVFALVSSNEGFPCALAEAMSTGLASVVSGIPANAQLVAEGIEGLQTPVGDAAAITGALRTLFQDPPLRKRMGAAARKRITENFSTEKVAARYEALFSEVLKGRPKNGG